jgi:nitroimidazol reductase NimA-like FMN-containing flavoprotein (pyridoxamine 5'-phosphate oxidase superfamily)
MNLNRDSSDFVVLDRLSCLERLAQNRVATVAITDGALPMVLPVLYLLRGEDILVGAAASGVLGRRMPNNVVSLCVHDLGENLAYGWTVTVTGLAELIASPAQMVDSEAFPQWGSGGSEQILVRIGTDRISGRQIQL